MTQIAEQTELSREQFYRSFSKNGNPTLKMTFTVMKVVEIKMTVEVPEAAQVRSPTVITWDSSASSD